VNSFGISELSHSNIGCTSITPLVWVPNAFSIDGNNPVFRPVMGYVDFNNYVFRIFNRWGEIVYETTDINEGWDGKKGRKIYEEGVYVWQIQFSDGSGADYEKRGFVTLLHYSKQ
jgi:gliding motility-associated-like protein